MNRIDDMTNDGLITVTVPGCSSRTYESLVVSVARAHHWKGLIDSGKFASISGLATTIGMNFSYAARIYRLTYLAPDIIEAILDGHEPDGLSMRVLRKPAPMEWSQQREWLGLRNAGGGD